MTLFFAPNSYFYGFIMAILLMSVKATSHSYFSIFPFLSTFKLLFCADLEEVGGLEPPPQKNSHWDLDTLSLNTFV